jgi:putative ABC transport system permease protein
VTAAPEQNSTRAYLNVLGKLLRAEWAAGILGLRLFMACVTIAAFMLGAVWVLGGGLSTILAKGGTTFLGGDVAITTNVPLDTDTENQLTGLGALSKAVELRSTGIVGDARTAIELKAVDSIYPLYGSVELVSGQSIKALFTQERAYPSAIVEPALLTRTGGNVGDVIRIGGQPFVIMDTLALEPDRLSAGRFMVGPRVIVHLDDVIGSPLVQRGAIVEYRYRVRADEISTDKLITAVEALKPQSGWELETPKDASDRVLRTVERTTSFLGVTGIVALTIGLSGAWAAAKTWMQRRGRTIALYRLSGATPGIVFALHAFILALASLLGLTLGLGAGFAVALPVLDIITERLHVPLLAGDILVQVFSVSSILLVGLIGTGLLALSGVSRIAPGSAMRSGEAPLQMTPKHVLVATAIILTAVIGAALSLPVAEIAGIATFGFLIVIGILAAVAILISRFIATRPPRGFFTTVMHQSLGNPGQMATRTVALGIGIIGITAIVAAQNSLNQALTSELPSRVPDLVLIDIQPAQVDDIHARIDASAELDGLQADPFMRMTITAINGVAAQDALVREDKSWVIEGDRSFSWTAEPTGAELLQGEWWANDYAGTPLVSPEEDMMEAFDLKVGDIIT